MSPLHDPTPEQTVTGAGARTVALAEGADRCTADAFGDYVEAASPTPAGRGMTLLEHWQAWRVWRG